MTGAVAIAGVVLAALVVFVGARIARSRRKGGSLRIRIFAALACAGLAGAFATGLYAVAEEHETIGFAARLVSVAPKALLLASVLLPVAAAVAAIVGRTLARPVEELADAASRIAQGEHAARLPHVADRDERRIAGAIATLRREVLNQPYATAFLRDACHDLKTPLAAIRATVEILEDGALDDPEAARRFVGNVSRATAQLEKTLGDLSTLARFETATIGDEKRLTIGAIVRAAALRVQPIADAHGVRVETPPNAPDPAVRGNAAALERALGNLLENAVDASAGGEVSVSLREAASGVVLDVTNEPAFVPRDIQDRLFERAVTSRAGKGTGLGLAIARAAVEAHGGTIRFVELGPPRVRVRVELPR